MDCTNQEKLISYLNSIETDGEITRFVMSRIRLESTFGQRETNAGIWALNFALITAIINLVFLIRQLPFRLIISCLATLRVYWAQNFNANFLITSVFIFALFALGIANWNIKKLGGENL